MKRIVILGSTGSIGVNTLKVLEHLQEDFQIVALAAKSNIDLLEEQAKKYHPEVIAVYDEQSATQLQKRIPDIPVLAGMEGVVSVAKHTTGNLVLSAISGFDGVLPTIKAIEAKKDIALANKEVLVSAGKLIMDLVQKNGVNLIPIDSELTAIFQCLKGENPKQVHRVILTASGGPFRQYRKEQLENIRVKDALNHPNYQMGAKVTIDSSTLMNKGFEMIETHYLFEMPIEKIEVLVHPQQIVHGMVEFIDGSIMAQMGRPEMINPIQVALTHPERKKGLLAPFDFTKLNALSFSRCDSNKFRCLDLAYQALKIGDNMPCFMNSANDALVKLFLENKISWLEIGQKLEILMDRHKVKTPKSYEDLAHVNNEAKRLVERI